MDGPSRRRVVVTGMGAVTAFGWGLGALRAGLRAGRTAIGDFDRFDPTHHRTRIAAAVPRSDAPEPGSSGPRDRRSNADRFALAAAREASRQASLGAETLACAGLFFSSSTGGMLEAEDWMDRRRAGRRGGAFGVLAAQPYSAPGDAVARDLGLRGPVITFSSACASATIAIAAALDALRSGEVDVALAGGSDELCRTTYGGFNALRAVDPRPCRPFRRDRAGLSLGEGSGVLVLEAADHAAARGVAPLAEVRGAGRTADAHHMSAPHPEGEGAARALAAALADAGLDAGEIAFVNLHGTGTEKNDEAEFAALGRIFGDRALRLPVTSTKSLVGHLLGAAGAIEAIATVVDLAEGAVHPTAGEGPVDPAAPADLVLGAPRAVPGAHAAVSLNLGFGGANAAVVIALARSAL